MGYYQNTEYAVAEGEKGKSDEELEKERERDAKKPIEWDRLMRDISTKPRVTRFQIKWLVFSSPFLSFFLRPLLTRRDLGT